MEGIQVSEPRNPNNERQADREKLREKGGAEPQKTEISKNWRDKDDQKYRDEMTREETGPVTFVNPQSI